MATTPPADSVRLPSWVELKQSLVIAGYVFGASLLTGLISHGIDLDHLANLVHAAEAGIAALLAALGYEGVAALRRAGKADNPTPGGPDDDAAAR